MKCIILAVSVLLLVSQSEALRCNCEKWEGCPGPTHECQPGENVCLAAAFLQVPERYFKRCAESSACSNLNVPGVVYATCCTTDLCN